MSAIAYPSRGTGKGAYCRTLSANVTANTRRAF